MNWGQITNINLNQQRPQWTEVGKKAKLDCFQLRFKLLKHQKLEITGFKDIINQGAKNFLFNKNYVGRRSLRQSKKLSLDKSIQPQLRRKSCVCKKCGKLSSKEIKFYHLDTVIKYNQNRNSSKNNTRNSLKQDYTKKLLTLKSKENIQIKKLQVKLKPRGIIDSNKSLFGSHLENKTLKNMIRPQQLQQQSHKVDNAKHYQINLNSTLSEELKFTKLSNNSFLSPSPEHKSIQKTSNVQQSQNLLIPTQPFKLPQILKSNTFTEKEPHNQRLVPNLICPLHHQQKVQKHKSKQENIKQKYYIKINSPSNERIFSKSPDKSSILNNTIDKSGRSLSPLTTFEHKIQNNQIPIFVFGPTKHKLNMYF